MSDSSLKNNRTKVKKNIKVPPQNKKKFNKKNRKRNQVSGSRSNAIKNNEIISPIQSLKLATGGLKSLPINVVVHQPSFNFIPVGLVSLGLVRGVLDPYAVYSYIFKDIASLISSGPGTAISRLNFMNHIYAALSPKSVPFRMNCNIAYVIDKSFDAALPAANLTVDGSFDYYMWVPTNVITSGWATQAAPPAYSDEESNTAYLNCLQSLAGDKKHNKVERNVQLYPDYIKDVSAFVSRSNYYGEGAGIGSPSCSVENEVPFRSSMLGTIVPFSPNVPRSSRVFHMSTGDSCSNWSIGALPDFPTSYYRGAVAPIFKFLDIDEVIASLVQFWAAIVTNALNSVSTSPEDKTFLAGGLGVDYNTFRIMVRQQLLWMFADSQCIAQFMSPQTSTGGFSPFICGSNCYPKNPNVAMNIPSVLNENLRMLKMCVRPYETKQYANNRNHVTHIPVWGAFKNSASIQGFATDADGIVHDMFLPDESPTPSIFDGTMGASVVDFNNTQKIATTVGVWNEVLQLCGSFVSGSTAMGGDGAGSPLLQFTRYVQWKVGDQGTIMPTTRIPRHMRCYVKEVEFAEDVPSDLKKKNSLKKIRRELVYNPPDSTVFSEFTLSFSGIIPITQTHKEFFPSLILPVIEIVNNVLPGQSQVQTSCLEPYKLETGVTPIVFNSRATEIAEGMQNYVIGLAGKKSELSAFVANLSAQNQGGFLGDLFSTLGNVGSSLGIPFVGEVGSIVGGIVNSVGL